MLEDIKEVSNRTLTENGAVTYESTGSECLDLFATVGALRRESSQEIIARYVRAYTENPDSAMKLLFFARDIRGGLGERRIFRVIMRWLAANEPQSLKKNIGYVAEYGRWDDLLAAYGYAVRKANAGHAPGAVSNGYRGTRKEQCSFAVGQMAAFGQCF